MSEVAGQIGQLQPSISPGYGFTAITVAFLGRLNPFGIFVARSTVALTLIGGETRGSSRAPLDLTTAFQGLLLLCVLGATRWSACRCRVGRGGEGGGLTLSRRERWRAGVAVQVRGVHGLGRRGRSPSPVAPLRDSTCPPPGRGGRSHDPPGGDPPPIVTASTPLLIAAIGELVAERAGVLNLGVEGMMAMGAACGFAAAIGFDSTAAGIATGILAGAGWRRSSPSRC